MTLTNFIKRNILLKLRPIRIKGSGNSVDIKCKIRGGHIEIFGNNNVVDVADSCLWNNCEILMTGDNNVLTIDPKARLLGPVRIVMEGNARLHLGVNCGVRGVDFALCDGSVSVGELVMFSYGIKIRNHDSHKVFVQGQSTPCNPPADIEIGRHVWICQNASILKGVKIGEDSIVAYGAIATKGCPPHCILAGNPAKIVKTGITWDY